MKNLLPKQLQKDVDNLFALRAKRLTLQRQADAIKDDETMLAEAVLTSLHTLKLDSVRTQTATASIRRTVVAQLVDEASFLKWAQKPANRDCLKVDVHGDAFRARLKDGVKVPGVTPFTKEALTVNKAPDSTL